MLLEIGAASAILALYRRYVQRRPLTGAGAHAFPTRGFGIQRMRARLRQLCVDPDRPTVTREPATGSDAIEPRGLPARDHGASA
jgi:hypothetical protein